MLLTWYTIEGDRAVSREARRAPEASKGTLTTLVAAKRLGRRHPATTYPTIQKTKQKTNVPRCSDAHVPLASRQYAKPLGVQSAHAESSARRAGVSSVALSRAPAAEFAPVPRDYSDPRRLSKTRRLARSRAERRRNDGSTRLSESLTIAFGQFPDPATDDRCITPITDS